MENINYKLEVFEGPLDLLLHLINKHKLNINDIPIFELVEQYVDYVRQMQESDMEIASEFIDMASRLIYIKTVSLLPVHEEAEQLKEELTGELIEYRDCKLIAKQLSERTDGFNCFERKPTVLAKDMKYKRLHEPAELFRFYLAAVGRGKKNLPPPLESFKAIVAKKIVSVNSRIVFIYRRLLNKTRCKLCELYEKSASRSELVATFLAVLELIRADKIKAEGEGDSMTVEFSNPRKSGE